MQKFLVSALALAFLASCGPKTAENTSTAATNTATPTPAPAAPDLSVAPAFNTNETDPNDAILMLEITELHKQLDPKAKPRQAIIKNNLDPAPYLAQTATKVDGDIVIHTFQDQTLYTKATIIYDQSKARSISLRGDKMESCSCGTFDPNADGISNESKMQTAVTFYHSPTKNKWVAIKNNPPSAEEQKQLFEECQAQAEKLKAFAATVK